MKRMNGGARPTAPGASRSGTATSTSERFRGHRPTGYPSCSASWGHSRGPLWDHRLWDLRDHHLCHRCCFPCPWSTSFRPRDRLRRTRHYSGGRGHCGLVREVGLLAPPQCSTHPVVVVDVAKDTKDAPLYRSRIPPKPRRQPMTRDSRSARPRVAHVLCPRLGRWPRVSH